MGVGKQDFSAMEELDGDEIRLEYNGKRAARDIVQFVPFRDFITKSYEALAEEVLQEFPDQLTSYFRSVKVEPVPREANAAVAVVPPTAPLAETVDIK